MRSLPSIAALSWSVTDEVRVRATRSRDQRSPNLTELFSGAVAGHNSIIDYPTSPTASNRLFSGLGQNYDPIGRFYRVGVKVDFRPPGMAEMLAMHGAIAS